VPSSLQIVPQKTERQDSQYRVEPPYRVIIHNDDVTPMDFVIHILMTVFQIPNPTAAHKMYEAHLNGSAYVQTLTRQEARHRINQAHFAAGLRGFPLKFSMEPE
jgi:ATP-dependent Clp protease adaptor protein ClpS